MIVTSPTAQWLELALGNCTKSLEVSSPYIGDYFVTHVGKVSERIIPTILTRTSIADFASSASDLEAVCKLSMRSGGVLSLSSLHSKVYVIDKVRALITSANATYSGLCRNQECGIEVTSPGEVQTLSGLIRSGFGAAKKPEYWTRSDLEQLREPVRVLRGALPKKVRIKRGAPEAPPLLELPRRQFHKFIESFSGWLQLTLEGLIQIKPSVFTMDDVWAVCAPLAQQRFPKNRFAREKLRQQMQRLRDLGLVAFLGKGDYELLACIR